MQSFKLFLCAHRFKIVKNICSEKSCIYSKNFLRRRTDLVRHILLANSEGFAQNACKNSIFSSFLIINPSINTSNKAVNSPMNTLNKLIRTSAKLLIK